MNLPEVSEKHEQERRSITAFRTVMEDGNYIVRDVRESDYGVDISLEIKLNKKYASNFISCVQIKDKLDSEKIENKDGKYVYQVEITNINYLANHPNSIFAIYLEDKRIFIWEWVYEIEKAIISDSIDLNSTTQEKYSYKFDKILDVKSKEMIHRKIMQVGERIKQYGKIVEDTSKESSITKALTLLNVDELGLIGTTASKVEELQKCITENRLHDALKKCTEIAKFIDNDISYLRCADICFKIKDYKATIKNCSKAASKNPSSYLAYLGLGHANQKLKEYPKAIGFYNKALKLKQLAVAYIEIGRISFINGDIVKAIDNLMTSLKIATLNDEYYIEAELLLADIYLSVYNITKAKFFIDRVLKVYPENGKALALLGDYYRNTNNSEEAIYYYQKCLDYENDNYNSLLGLSLVYFKSNAEKALIFFTRWVKVYLSKQVMNLTKGNMLIIHIDWEGTTFISLSSANDGKINVHLGDGLVVPIDITNENGFILIGAIKNIDKHYEIPLVGKVFERFEDYNNAVSNIENNINLVKNFTEKGQSLDFDNETQLIVEEGMERVYIKIIFNNYVITGFTDANTNKKGFYEFVKAFEKYKVFQVQLSNKENEDVLFFVVNDNVSIEKI